MNSDHSPEDILGAYGSRVMEAAREEARLSGRELLTPAAASALFRVSDAAVRTARLKGHVKAVALLSPTNKETHLLDLTSALAYWAERRGKVRMEDFNSELDRMRMCGLTVWNDGQFYHILHPWAFFEREYKQASS